VYHWDSGSTVLLVGIYVDFLIITITDEKEVEALKAQMKMAFDMSDLGYSASTSELRCARMPAASPFRQTHYAKRISS